MSDEPTIVKCLVWDLDDTLWKGILSEGDDVAVPDEVRATVVELDRRGVLQAIASRNDHDHAWAKLEEVGLAEYFVLPQIHWGSKDGSIRAIAERLQFAESTIAFIDDSDHERASVAHHLPAVRCYHADRAAELTSLPEFSPATVTIDSRRRRGMYQAGFVREAARAEHAGPDEEFIATLGLELTLRRADEEDVSRLEELTLRTSQMNATGVHYGDEELRRLRLDPRHEVVAATMSDRFGPHGAIGVVLLERHETVWHLKLLATSCRVVSFGTGNVILRWLVDSATAAGARLVADFRPTERNRMMEIAYRFAGFVEPGEDGPDLGVLPTPDDPATQRLVAPSTRLDPPTAMRLTAVDLTEAAR